MLPQDHTSFGANIRHYFILAALRGAATGMPIVLWVVFLQKHHGYSLTQVTLLDLPMWLGIFLFEIPTGVVADRYGRKLSLALSAVVGAAVWIVFSSTGMFWLLAFAQFIGGLAATFSSGADEALLYESVKIAGREDEYTKISGRARAIRTASAMLAGLAVGAIAAVDLLLPAWITAGLIALSLVPILSFRETLGHMGREEAEEHEKAAPTPYSTIVRQAFATVRQNPALSWAIAYLVILSCAGFFSEVFMQPYAVEMGVPMFAMGGVMMALQAMSIAGYASVGRAQKVAGTERLLFGVPVLLVPCLLLLGAAPSLPAIGLAALAAFLFAITEPVLLAVIQKKAPDKARATVLSIRSLIATLFMTLTEPGLGVLSDRFGVHTAYLAIAALVALFTLALVARGRAWLASHPEPAAA